MSSTFDEWKSLQLESYRVVNFWMFCVFLSHLLVVQLLLLALLLIQILQMFPPLVLLHHLVPLELVVAVLVKVLQVFGRLRIKTNSWEGEMEIMMAGDSEVSKKSFMSKAFISIVCISSSSPKAYIVNTHYCQDWHANPVSSLPLCLFCFHRKHDALQQSTVNGTVRF